MSPWRIAAAVSGWLLAVTVVSCLAWLAIASAGHRVGLTTTTVQPVAGRPAGGAGDADGAAPGTADRSGLTGQTGATADGRPTAPAVPAPVTGGSGAASGSPPGGSEQTWTNGTGSAAAADPPAPTDPPQPGGSFLGAAAPARAAASTAPARPAAVPTAAPSTVLPTVTSHRAKEPSARTAPASTASTAPSPAGRMSGTFAASGGELLLTCSSSTVVDWRVLASIGWAATGGLQSPAALLVTFTRSAQQTLVRGDCSAGVPVFSASGAGVLAGQGVLTASSGPTADPPTSPPTVPAGSSQTTSSPQASTPASTPARPSSPIG